MTNPFHDDDDDATANDADDELDNDDHHHLRHSCSGESIAKELKNYHKKKIPMLLFVPTKELITDTFRLASIARDIGMDFHPSPSLSHLFFSYPSSSSSSSSPSSSSPSSSLSTLIPNNAVPLPFPNLSIPTVSLSLLRYFVSLSRGMFKLVFFQPGSKPRPGSELDRIRAHDVPNPCLFSRVSGRKVGSMDDLSRDLAGRGWCLFRTHKPSSSVNSVYVFLKKDLNRVRVRVRANGGGGGECRVRELRLPALDFGNEVPLRILLYILLMTDDVFYLA